MASNFKYTMQKHKGKVWLSGSILATVAVGAGVWLAISEDSPFTKPEEAISYLASHVVTAGADGQVRLVGVDTNEVVNTTALAGAGSYLYAPSQNREAVYAYDGKSLQMVEVVDGALTSRVISDGLPQVAGASDFAFEGNELVVYSGTAKTVTTINVETNEVVNTVKETESVVQLAVGDGFSYYITDSELIQLKGKDAVRIELGSSLLSLHEEEGKLVVHSGFGNAMGENILFYVNGETLEIESLQKTGAPDSIMLSKDDGEEHYMAGHYVGSETPFYQLERYKVGAEGLTKDTLTVKVPIGDAEVAMSAKSSVLDHDYIYSHVAGNLQVFDVKSQSFIHQIPVEVDFAMPVLPEGGGADA